MAYDEGLAARVRSTIGDHPGLAEKRMFGGLAFLVGGNMAVAVSGDELMVRVGKDAHDEAVARPGARTVNMGGRRMTGWIKVAPGTLDDASVTAWIDEGIAYAQSLPPK